MKFRTKIIVVYIIFAIAAAFFCGGIYYHYSAQNYYEQGTSTLQDLSRQLTEQYDESIRTMKDVSQYILSDTDTIGAVQILSSYPQSNDELSLYYSDAVRSLRSTLNSDYINSNFERVIFFNQNGVVITSQDGLTRLKSGVRTDSLSWLDKVDKVPYGDFLVLGLHHDNWTVDEPEVLSVIKKIQGHNLGYIEVQSGEDQLRSLMTVSNRKISVSILDGQGKLIYPRNGSGLTRTYQRFIDSGNLSARKVKDENDKHTQLIAGHQSEESDAVIVVSQPYDSIFSQLNYILPMSLGIACGFMVIAILYIMITSRYLTRPMKELTTLMEQTDLENIEEQIGIETSNDEIKVLSNSYQNMLDRLNKAIIKEKQLSLMQMQAQFDALQAQVNPHFIYNILNVISSRGIMNDDEVICDICDNLAGMLRYSTNYKERFASVKEETEYLKSYYKLLKSRYEYKLEYEITIDPVLYDYQIPKLAMQQISENSIAHGFENVSA